MLGWIGTIGQFVGITLNIRKCTLCWPVWTVASGLLLIHHWGDWSAVALFAMYEVFNIYGWIAWSKKKEDSDGRTDR